MNQDEQNVGADPALRVLGISAEEDRRRFLLSAGKFAAVVPPSMTALLSTTMSSPAIAQSGGVVNPPGGGGGGGFTDGGGGGFNTGGNPPGNPTARQDRPTTLAQAPQGGADLPTNTNTPVVGQQGVLSSPVNPGDVYNPAATPTNATAGEAPAIGPASTLASPNSVGNAILNAGERG